MMNKVMSVKEFKALFSDEYYEIEIDYTYCDFQYEVDSYELFDCLTDDEKIIVNEIDFPTSELMGYVKATFEDKNSSEWDYIACEYFGYEYNNMMSYYEHIDFLIDEMRGK